MESSGVRVAAKINSRPDLFDPETPCSPSKLLQTMALAASTANWHWKTKQVSPWARDWFTAQLAGLSTKDGQDTISIESVTEVDGDVEIGQRKSKYAFNLLDFSFLFFTCHPPLDDELWLIVINSPPQDC